ncbi:MAG: hypothetical protein ACRDJW_10230 [Thermomicrobiales bacterium]
MASNCPPARQQTLDVGPFALVGTPPPADGVAEGYAPRRTVLDQILVEAAASPRPLYELTCQFAALQPPPPEMQQILGALRDNQEQTDRFIGTVVSTVPIPEFFAPDNIGRIVGNGLAAAA